MKCIPHADDCGLTADVTRDIFACIGEGRLASTSVIMGGERAGESLDRLAGMPHVRACLHLNLLEGRAVAPPKDVACLVGPDGFFRHGLAGLWSRLAASSGRGRRTLLAAVRTEWEAQIEAFKGRYRPGGASPDLRLDGHLHVHAMPELDEVMEGILAAHAPAWVRLPLEPPHAAPLPFRNRVTGMLRRALLAGWSKGLARMLERRGVPHNAWLSGVLSGGCMDEGRLRASLAAIRAAGCGEDDVVEIMLHPGGDGAPRSSPCIRASHRGFFASPARKVELALVLSGRLDAVLEDLGATRQR
ncbi:MAG: ChbG/HpnK family deacetylase [Desulfovibrio sp.]|jgi:predicted glycoside hydrolase/deacetylase ChbG (UPF0249 family)|nr:ChbG/HpnK family deacetylase [Desulfovibrio sp.]